MIANPAPEPRFARHLVRDDFLPREAADKMLRAMIAAEPHFTPSTIGGSGTGRVDASYRSSLRLPPRIGVDETPLVDAILSRLDAFCEALGLSPFVVHRSETSVVAHRDGDFYKRHLDTRIGVSDDPSIRVVSCVYYLNRTPRGFSGGELAIYPLVGEAAPTLIEAVHNRLVVFPSFVPHEVLSIRSTSGFAESRFSVNCWMHRTNAGGSRREEVPL